MFLDRELDVGISMWEVRGNSTYDLLRPDKGEGGSAMMTIRLPSITEAVEFFRVCCIIVFLTKKVVHSKHKLPHLSHRCIKLIFTNLNNGYFTTLHILDLVGTSLTRPAPSDDSTFAQLKVVQQQLLSFSHLIAEAARGEKPDR